MDEENLMITEALLNNDEDEDEDDDDDGDEKNEEEHDTTSVASSGSTSNGQELNDNNGDDGLPPKRGYAKVAIKSACFHWTLNVKLLVFINVEVQFSDPSQCPTAEDTIVIGINPGEVNTITAAKIDPKDPNSRDIIKVKRYFLYDPTIKFRNLLQTLTEYFDYMMSTPEAEAMG
ncbi:hypothetical protein BGZ65_004577 [Modicella reniformis]|uniref:Uncharacterized protein n=1 Tax=Modicella reniformis TaxID=1440133 RepID=A0A9P6M8U8_9FUNG|nr:hypothetical protein BGZ65_004577 [Modicella reniformis]